MSKKTSPTPLKNSNWVLSGLWAWFVRGLFATVFLFVCAAAIIISLGFIGALLPVLYYVLWGLIIYIVIMREEFSSFRKAFYHNSSFSENGKSFLCCLCQFKKKWCPCLSRDSYCKLKSYCCCQTNDCQRSESDSEKTAEPVEPPAPEKKVTPAKKKPTPKKAPAKKESSS